MTHKRQDLGRLGEDLAAERLKKEGYRIVQRNYRNSFGEIDIIARDGKILCFIEVRTRTEIWHGHPLESISAVKQRKLIRAAQGYLMRATEGSARQDAWDTDARFDVVAVIPDETGGYSIEIIKNAFEEG
jgi:putative endonuclease